PLPRGRTEPRPFLARLDPQPHADADLHRRLSREVPASGPHPDVEPRGGGVLLRDSAAFGLSAAGGALPSALATEARREHAAGAGLDQPDMGCPGAHRSLVSRRRSAVAADL